MDNDERLRTLYRLAEAVEGEELARVQEAIARRRAELELDDSDERDRSFWDGAPGPQREADRLPGAGAFEPMAAGAAPERFRRPGERRFRIGRRR